MPWTESQMKLWRAAAHNPTIARSHGLSTSRARTFMNEGVKRAQGGLAQYGGGNDDPTLNIPGDPNLDPRSRALAEINKRLAQQSSFMSAQRASSSITAPLRGGRRLGLPHLADPWAAQYMMHAPFDTQLGYNRYPVPDRLYAEGGQVEGNELGGGATAAMLLAALRARHVNAIARPFQRAMAKPVLGMEAVSRHPLSGIESDARYNMAREGSMHEFGDLPVHRGQGAWTEGDGEQMQFNPLYMQELPRTLGRLRNAPEHMRYAGQMGENLEQMATPVSRFVPHLINTPEGANAMQFSGIDDRALRELAEKMGSGWVAAHRPGNKAMTFALGDWSLEKMARRIEREMPGVKTRYGRSDPLTDRVLLAREPLGFEDILYREAGAEPRSSAYAAFERAGLRKPEPWASDLGAK